MNSCNQHTPQEVYEREKLLVMISRIHSEFSPLMREGGWVKDCEIKDTIFDINTLLIFNMIGIR